MTAYREPVWSVPLAGRRIEIPSSLRGVRAALEEARAAEFDAEAMRTPGASLVYTVLDWALPGWAAAEDPAAVARLRAGDFTGVLDGDGRPVAPSHPPRDPVTGERPSATYKTGFPVGSVTFPATIEGIRAELRGERLAEFERDIVGVPAQELVYATLRWGYPPERLAEEDALIDRLKAELFAGVPRRDESEPGDV
ncbi:hypothetical protein GCM10010387_04400 [Streptomyces inusitatus]|uniref:Uncharacterized protein n=1 Tax=Streptomyces inusitatus TaxID=68221 RepID=A0A918UJX4_9ACTN|nr:hypothetical protein [Streptomyces inusitatus]GGZ15221.1 hypothetical protein GCM10010387_04400 [Streptomyces inusitatus]